MASCCTVKTLRFTPTSGPLFEISMVRVHPCSFVRMFVCSVWSLGRLLVLPSWSLLLAINVVLQWRVIYVCLVKYIGLNKKR